MEAGLQRQDRTFHAALRRAGGALSTGTASGGTSRSRSGDELSQRADRARTRSGILRRPASRPTTGGYALDTHRRFSCLTVPPPDWGGGGAIAALASQVVALGTALCSEPRRRACQHRPAVAPGTPASFLRREVDGQRVSVYYVVHSTYALGSQMRKARKRPLGAATARAPRSPKPPSRGLRPPATTTRHAACSGERLIRGASVDHRQAVTPAAASSTRSPGSGECGIRAGCRADQRRRSRRDMSQPTEERTTQTTHD